MRVSAGELRELFFQPGGSILLQNYINVGNKSLAAEFGVPCDAIEYNWTEADVNKCLLEDDINSILNMENIPDFLLLALSCWMDFSFHYKRNLHDILCQCGIPIQ